MNKKDFIEAAVINMLANEKLSEFWPENYWERAEKIWEVNPFKEVTTEAKKVTTPRFIPPTLKEAEDYCREKGYKSVNPTTWYNFYETNGWMVSGRKMKNWKSALAYWESNSKQKTESITKKKIGLV